MKKIIFTLVLLGSISLCYQTTQAITDSKTVSVDQTNDTGVFPGTIPYSDSDGYSGTLDLDTTTATLLSGTTSPDTRVYQYTATYTGTVTSSAGSVATGGSGGTTTTSTGSTTSSTTTPIVDNNCQDMNIDYLTGSLSKICANVFPKFPSTVVEGGSGSYLQVKYRVLPSPFPPYTMNGIGWDQTYVLNEPNNSNGIARTFIDDSSGEWGMGIDIESSNNVYIENANVSNAWGDGIYLGALYSGTRGQPYNQNVVLQNINLNNNRRQGISVISAINLTINNPVITNTNGTEPQSGIDFEPNNPGEYEQNITINNPNIQYNAKKGIQFYLGNTPSGTTNIAINNSSNIKNNGAQNIKFYTDGTASMNGLVTVDGSSIFSNGSAGVATDTIVSSTIPAAIINVQSDGATGNDTSDDTAAIQRAINDGAAQGKTVYFPVGNYYINPSVGLTLKNDSALKFENGAKLISLPTSSGYYQIIRIWGVSNVKITGYPTIIGDRNVHINSGSMRGRYFAKSIRFNYYIQAPDGTTIPGSSNSFTYNVPANCYDNNVLDIKNECKDETFYLPTSALPGVVPPNSDWLNFKNPGQYTLHINAIESQVFRYQTLDSSGNWSSVIEDDTNTTTNYMPSGSVYYVPATEQYNYDYPFNVTGISSGSNN